MKSILNDIAGALEDAADDWELAPTEVRLGSAVAVTLATAVLKTYRKKSWTYWDAFAYGAYSMIGVEGIYRYQAKGLRKIASLL